MSRFIYGDIIKISTFDNEMVNHYIVQEVKNDGLQFLFVVYSVFEDVTLQVCGENLYNYIKVSKYNLLSAIDDYNRNHYGDEDVKKIDINNVFKILKDNK